jgi:DnaK suppressor protein
MSQNLMVRWDHFKEARSGEGRVRVFTSTSAGTEVNSISVTGRQEIAMDEDRAKELLAAERLRVDRLLSDVASAGQADRESVSDTGDIADPAEPLTSQEGQDAIAEGLRSRLAAVERAEDRLAAGTYGRSVKSNLPIPDERLEADPAAELTIEEEAETAER